MGQGSLVQHPIRKTLILYLSIVRNVDSQDFSARISEFAKMSEIMGFLMISLDQNIRNNS
jgi:hypothetical protein